MRAPNSSAAAPPAIGVIRLYACSMSVTRVWPVAWNAAAATIRIAAFTSIATNSDTQVSMRTSASVSRIVPRAPPITRRVCTTDECR